MTRFPDLPRGFHLQCIVEAIEIMKESDGSQQFHHFAFIKMTAQFGPERVINIVSVGSHPLSQAQRSFFAVAEIRAALKMMQVIDLVFRPAQPSCQDGVRRQSILTAIDL